MSLSLTVQNTLSAMSVQPSILYIVITELLRTLSNSNPKRETNPCICMLSFLTRDASSVHWFSLFLSHSDKIKKWLSFLSINIIYPFYPFMAFSGENLDVEALAGGVVPFSPSVATLHTNKYPSPPSFHILHSLFHSSSSQTSSFLRFIPFLPKWPKTQFAFSSLEPQVWLSSP